MPSRPPIPDLPILNDVERACLARYLDVLRETLGADLVKVVVFGSVARGEAWPRGMPMRSDLDLLVVTEDQLPQESVDRLIDATMLLFLESGRQLGPQFKSRERLSQPRTEQEAAFFDQVRREGIVVYETATSRRLRQ